MVRSSFTVFAPGLLSPHSEEGPNRRYYSDRLKGEGLKDILTFKQPNLTKHVTYRHKHPPPTDWLQFASDPRLDAVLG